MKNFGIILVLAIVAGGLAGVIAAVFTNQSLDQYAQSLADQDSLLVISEEKPRPLPGTYEEALEQVQETGWPAIATIRAASEDSSVAASWITDDSVVGAGTVITSDGWVLFHKDVLVSFAEPETQAEVWVERQRYSIEQVVEDSKTDFLLIKIDAQSLTTLAFGLSDAMFGGDLLFALPSDSEIIPTSLKDGEELVDGIINRAEDYSTQWEIIETLESPAPVLNAAGELVAFSHGDLTATPLHHVRPFIQSTLRHGVVSHAAVGAYVVSIDDIINIDPEISERTRFGALVIAPNLQTAAVVPGGPADLAGLEDGDIIISVDDVLIDDQTSLAELLSAYEPAQVAQLEVLRGEDVVELTVEFAELSEVY